MSNEFELSRRKALAALGTVGIASAGAGLGTSAYFSDQETFENNRLVAGRLDLKVDWEEHYSDWSADESAAVSDVLMLDPGDTVQSGYVGLPDPENPLIAIPEDDLDGFMDATAVEAYPDTDDDGVQDPIPSDTTACEYLADVGNDDDGLDPAGPRTDNDDTNPGGETAPLLNLQDLKPGDFGELTLSFHLCDNPGYVWLNGTAHYNAENDVTEPEGDDPDETDDVGDADPLMGGELVNAIRTRLWYDDGDNVVEDGEVYLTPEVSLADLLCIIDMTNGIPLCAETGGVIGAPNGDTDETVACPSVEGPDAYDTLHETGDEVVVNTPLTEGPEPITIRKNPFCSDFGLVEGVRTDDDSPEGELPVEGTKTYDTPYGTFTVTTEQIDDDWNRITSWSFDPVDDDVCVAKVAVKGGNEGANVYSYDNPDGDDNFTDDDPTGVTGHENADLTTPTEQRISHADFCLGMVEPTDDPGGGTEQEDGCCFQPSTSHYLGFAWWLPVDHANELQSDGVGFDLGFYTEQCRHNDGSGMNNANVDPDEYDA